MSPLWLLLPTALAMLAAWSCWCESLRCDRYRDWMIEESIRADKAESLAAWRMLTHAEREAIAWLTGGESPFPEEEQRMATLRAFLERHAKGGGA